MTLCLNITILLSLYLIKSKTLLSQDPADVEGGQILDEGEFLGEICSSDEQHSIAMIAVDILKSELRSALVVLTHFRI
jgi:hypothetical protein